MKDLLVKLKMMETKDWYGRTEYRSTGFGFFMGFVAAFVATTALVIAMVVPPVYQSCQNRAEIVGMDYEWDFFSGCFYPYEGRMVPDSVWFNNQSDTTLELEQR